MLLMLLRMLTEYCKRLEPLIEAVFDWPLSGDVSRPVQNIVQQYLKQAVAAASARGQAGIGPAGPIIVHVQELMGKLLALTESWRDVRDTDDLAAAYDGSHATVNMFVGAVMHAASELKLRQGTPDWLQLLGEGYSAGA